MAFAHIAVRHPLPPPQPVASIAEVSFCHPGYEPPHDLLFKLPRFDEQVVSPLPSGVVPAKGLHYGTALAACQIASNNASDGYLAVDRAGHGRVNCPFDSVLTGDKYWFFATSEVSPSQQPYPIVPSFQDWMFPHHAWHSGPDHGHSHGDTVNCVAHWHEPPPILSGRCIVTQTSGLIQSAHIIPSVDREWFQRNVMSQYGTHHDIDQSANMIDFRNDIHAAFDDHWFAIVPKDGDYTIHQLVAAKVSAREFADTFHNLPVLGRGSGPVSGEACVSREFLYARFARAVLLMLKPFVAQSAVRRRVARYRSKSEGNSEAEDDLASPRLDVQWLSPEQLHREYSGGGTRSASPSKRKRGSGEEEEYEEDEDEDDREIHRTTIDDSLEEEERGRPRKRRFLGDVDKGRDITPPHSYASSASRSSLCQRLH